MRRALSRLHRWLGLGCGIIFFLVCASGCLLLFEEPISGLLDGPLRQTAERPVSLERIREAAERRLYDGEWVQRIYWPPNRVRVRGPEGVRTLYFSPQDAAFLGVGNTLMTSVVKFHRSLLLSDGGRWITLTSCLFVILTLLSGLRLWLPASLKLVGKALTIRQVGTRYRQILDLHRVLGALVALPLLLIAFTGLNYSKISNGYRNALFAAMGERPLPKPDPLKVIDSQPLSLDQLTELAVRIYPEAELSCLELEEQAGSPVKVRFRHPGQPGEFGQSNVLLHPHTGAVLRTLNAMELPPAQQFVYVWALPLHRGEAFGSVHKAVWVAVVLIGCGLPVSGIWLWYSRRSRKRDRGDKLP